MSLFHKNTYQQGTTFVLWMWDLFPGHSIGWLLIPSNTDEINNLCV